MKISYDPAKRNWTLLHRGLDFEAAATIFAGRTFDVIDDRKDYGETRVVSIGFLKDRMVIVGWTRRGDLRHVFTMRRANAREQRKFRARLEGD